MCFALTDTSALSSSFCLLVFCKCCVLSQMKSRFNSCHWCNNLQYMNLRICLSLCEIRPLYGLIKRSTKSCCFCVYACMSMSHTCRSPQNIVLSHFMRSCLLQFTVQSRVSFPKNSASWVVIHMKHCITIVKASVCKLKLQWNYKHVLVCKVFSSFDFKISTHR